MIRINLLGGERQKPRKAVAFESSQHVTVACSLVLVLAAGGIGAWYWSLTRASAAVDADIVAAEQERARLRPLLNEVQQFEARRTQLQQRVALIEQLRKGQSVPVQLLDHISRSLPDMLWLTQMDQAAGAITLEGRSTTLIALSDFVGNLGNSGLIKKPIEIVNSQLENTPGAGPTQPASDLIKFTVKAHLAGEPAQAPAAVPVTVTTR